MIRKKVKRTVKTTTKKDKILIKNAIVNSYM